MMQLGYFLYMDKQEKLNAEKNQYLDRVMPPTYNNKKENAENPENIRGDIQGYSERLVDIDCPCF